MDYARVADTYVKGLEHLKKITERQDTLKKLLTKALDEEGEVDDKGHRWLAAGDYVLQRQKRQGKPFLNREAVEAWAKDMGFFDDVKVVVEAVDEDALAGWVYEHRNESTKDEYGVERTVQEYYDSLFITPEPTYAFMPPQKGKTYDY